MSLADEVSTAWMDGDRLPTPAPCTGGINGSGNGLLYLSLLMIQLKRRGEFGPKEKEWWDSVILSCEVEPGLFKRGPHQPDQEAMDDLTMVALASKILNDHVAIDMVQYGRRHFPPYVFNNVNPGKLKFTDGRWNTNAMLFRMLQLVAHLKWCASERPNFILRAYTAAVIATSGKPGDQDSWLFSWALIQSSKGESWLCAWAAKRWQKRMLKEWGSFQAVVAKCLRPNHPIAVYWMDL